jgi:hypothetical protein
MVSLRVLPLFLSNVLTFLLVPFAGRRWVCNISMAAFGELSWRMQETAWRTRNNVYMDVYFSFAPACAPFAKARCPAYHIFVVCGWLVLCARGCRCRAHGGLVHLLRRLPNATHIAAISLLY